MVISPVNSTAYVMQQYGMGSNNSVPPLAGGLERIATNFDTAVISGRAIAAYQTYLRLVLNAHSQ